MTGRASDTPPGRLMTPGFTALLIAQAGFGYAFSSFLMLPKFLVTELGAGPAVIGRVMAVYGVAVVISMPALGAAVDRFGRRNFLTGGALIMLGACLAFVLVDTIGPLLYLLRGLQGVAFAMAFAAGGALAVDEAPPDRVGQAIGIFGLAFLSMNAIAPAVVELLAAAAGWAVAFTTAAGGAAMCAVLSRRVRDSKGLADSGPAPGLWEVASRPSQIRLSLVVALVGAGLSAVFTFHQPWALELGASEVRSLFVAYAVTAVSVRIGLGRFVDRAGRRRVSIAALVPYVFAVAGMAALRPGGLALFGALLGASHGRMYPALNAVAVQGVGIRERGKVMALFQTAFQVGFAVSALILGLIAEHAGYPSAFLAGGGCVLAALILFVASPEGRDSIRQSPR